MEDEFREATARFMANMRANLAAWDALPDDAMIKCDVCPGYHSVTTYR